MKRDKFDFKINQIKNSASFFFFFFFSGAKATDPVVQWSVQWPNDITILNGAGVQWLCRVTPDGGYTSTPK